MKLQAIIHVNFDTPITEVSEHAKLIDDTVKKLQEKHGYEIEYEIKERRDMKERARKKGKSIARKEAA